METFKENTAISNNTTDTLNYTGVAGKAFGHDFFKCSNDVFQDCIKGRQKHKRWENFIGKNTDLSKNIKSYIQDNKNKKFLLQNERTGEFVFADSRFN